MRHRRVIVLVLMCVAPRLASAQERPAQAPPPPAPPGYAAGADSMAEPTDQAPGASGSDAAVKRLEAENDRLKREVALLEQKVHLLEERLRTLEGSE